MTTAHESSTRALRNEYEAQLATMQGEYEKRLAGADRPGVSHTPSGRAWRCREAHGVHTALLTLLPGSDPGQ